MRIWIFLVWLAAGGAVAMVGDVARECGVSAFPAGADGLPAGDDSVPPRVAVVSAGGAEAKSAAERAMERQGMVDVGAMDTTLAVRLMYARADNFTGRVLYTDLRRAYLHPEAARALVRASGELRRRAPGMRLLVCDAARPMSVQQRMWDTVKGTPLHIYVSNPARGGGLHNYGLAVDVTLCDAATGREADMGTPVDHLGPEAHVRGEEALVAAGKLSPGALANRRLLRRAMESAGFRVLSTEWWHFNLRTRAEARARYRVLR